MNQKRNIAVFDFDGTLTRRDSLFAFLLFTHGRVRTYLGLLLLSPAIMLMFLGIIDNNKCKEILFTYFFKGLKYSEFQRLGKEFAESVTSPNGKEHEGFFNPDTCAILRQHLADGHKVYIISASVDEWIRPIAQSLGVTDALCTHLAIDADGRLTGRYDGKNCHGQEKVNRFLAIEPHRDTYYLYAYGDSNGDKQLFALADEYKKIKH